MLRVILATCGVGLIAFGLFGGKSLEQVHAGLSGVFDRYKGTDNIEAVEAVVDAADSTSEQLASAVDDATDNTEAGTQTVAMATPSAVADQADETDATVTAANVVTDSTGTDVDTDDAPLATTQTAVLAASEERQLEVASVQAVSAVAGNDSSVVENAALTEVKASARNEELERALSTTGSEGKDADVGVVMQATNGNSDVEALFVLKDLVNMRQGPSIDHAIVLRLEKGQELMEFKREGKWVHVGAYGTSGKIGWVHQRLVGKTPG
jgi:hypothetical protein